MAVQLTACIVPGVRALPTLSSKQPKGLLPSRCPAISARQAPFASGSLVAGHLSRSIVNMCPRPARQTAQQRGHRRVTIMGLPIPVVGFLFNPTLLAVAWAFGAVKFWSGYHKTSFESDQAKRVALTAMWPLLYLASENYRSGFKKALKD